VELTVLIAVAALLMATLSTLMSALLTALSWLLRLLVRVLFRVLLMSTLLLATVLLAALALTALLATLVLLVHEHLPSTLAYSREQKLTCFACIGSRNECTNITQQTSSQSGLLTQLSRAPIVLNIMSCASDRAHSIEVLLCRG